MARYIILLAVLNYGLAPFGSAPARNSISDAQGGVSTEKRRKDGEEEDKGN